MKNVLIVEDDEVIAGELARHTVEAGGAVLNLDDATAEAIAALKPAVS